MTKEQARLLRDVLYDAVTNSLKGVEFPTTIITIIDAKIDVLNNRIAMLNGEWCDEEKSEAAALRDLRETIITEG